MFKGDIFIELNTDFLKEDITGDGKHLKSSKSINIFVHGFGTSDE